MSGEVGPAKRISLANLQPADVIFFGAAGPRSKPRQVNHMGIYLGNGWFMHSSGYGVALASLSGWYANRFAWGRRPLAEAGLVSSS
jgi:cell wall-associated NlpC family hydrolase